jgi:ParB family chromosome partitioning protein
MSKLDALRSATGANVAESTGRGVARAVTHGASTTGGGPDRWAGLTRISGAQRIPLDRIIPDPAQPRTEFEEAELIELAESIRARGILQPIRVRWDEGQGMYVIIAGERRLRAARRAGCPDAPCVIHDGPLTESEVLLDQLAENLVRLDLRPIETARAFKRLMDGNGWSARRLAEELHIDHDKVNRAVKLLDLPESVQASVATGAIAPSTAVELAKIDDAEAQQAVAARVVAEGLSRDQVAASVRRRPKGRAAKPRKVTTRTIRTGVGIRVTLEGRRGLDVETMLAALAEVAARIKAESVGAEAA